MVVGLSIGNVGEAIYRRLGVWTCAMKETNLHQFYDLEFIVGLDKTYERRLFTII
jgi:hypothetical protein